MNILIFAPHPDDEVLGCGGTMLKHAQNGHSVYVCVVTKGMPPLYTDEESIAITRREQMEAHKLLGVKKTIYLDFPAAMLEEVERYKLNKAVSDAVNGFCPEIVYIPHFGDMQKDHTLVSESVMVAVRPRGNYSVKKVLSYETLSETEWNIPHAANAFMPNVFSDISLQIDDKIAALEKFKSQMAPFPAARSTVAIRALAQLRGSSINVAAAEAFALIREIL